MKAGWRRLARRPATGASFILLIALATAIAITVTVWSLWSVTGSDKARGMPDTFRI